MMAVRCVSELADSDRVLHVSDTQVTFQRNNEGGLVTLHLMRVARRWSSWRMTSF